MTNDQLIAIEMKPLEGCAAVLVSFNRPFTHVEMNAMHRALNEHLIPHAPEPGVVTRLPVPGTQMTRLSDIADELIRQLRKQGMEKMQAVFDGMRLRIDPWPEPQAASRDASSGWQIGPDTRDPGCKCVRGATFVDSSACPVHGISSPSRTFEQLQDKP